jgi:hypothetical protein
MNKKYTIAILAAAAIGIYWYMNKNKYPAGLMEGDYIRIIKGDGTVFLLSKGQKIPLTLNYITKIAPDAWGKVKELDNSIIVTIPTGTTLDA